MKIEIADNILCGLEELAQIYDYDIDNDENYKVACEIVTECDWNEMEIAGFELDEFNRFVNTVYNAINAIIEEEQ